ncbi:Flp pilus assembly protein TadD [Neorhizobium galegae bv. orientalis]|nr:Flp pilus assembly protein TadD [Neorhizobium galegae bv. orientalis]
MRYMPAPHSEDVAPDRTRPHPMTASAAVTLRKTRLAQTAALAILAVLSVTGCATKRDVETTGSIPRASAASMDGMNANDLASTEKSVGASYARDPKNKQIGLQYATVLGMTGKNAQALAVMQQVVIAHPADRDVLAAYGKAQAGAGQLEQALATINRAQTPDHPDWRLYSAEGAVLDQLGRSAEARQKYRMALDTQPNEPSVMSNLGMSYVLSGDLKTAEAYMRNAAGQPAADSRVRQNLALVVGLQGRFAEAEQIARRELSQQQADANVTYLRSMLSQQNAWAKLADKDGKSKPNTN